MRISKSLPILLGLRCLGLRMLIVPSYKALFVLGQLKVFVPGTPQVR
jgi:hypothetical protein